ncbi:MAG: polysaccharide deacetylase family protein [Acidobacteriota bacterium]
MRLSKRTKITRERRGRSADRYRLQTLLGDLSHSVAPERLGVRLSDRVLWRAKTDEPNIALTFDDGPQPLYTPALLEVLDRGGVPATFFLVGKNVEMHPELARRIVRAGHEVGNHSYSHSFLLLSSEDKIRREILRTDELLRSIDGAAPRFFRPPAGLFSNRMLDIAEDLGYRAVVGDVYPRDPHYPGRRKIVRRVLERVAAGSIIILHDGGGTRRLDRSQTLEAVREIIPRLREKGFRFMTLSDLLSNA